MVSKVAVKTLRAGSNAETAIRFLREGAVMGQFRHDNIVRLYGVVADGEPVSARVNVLLFFFHPPPPSNPFFSLL